MIIPPSLPDAMLPVVSRADLEPVVEILTEAFEQIDALPGAFPSTYLRATLDAIIAQKFVRDSAPKVAKRIAVATKTLQAPPEPVSPWAKGWDQKQP